MNKIIKSVYQLIPNKLRNYLERNILYRYRSEMTSLIEEAQLGPVIESSFEYLEDNSKGELGDYLEFGVYNGTSLSIAFKTLIKMNNKVTRLFGFDSFEGLPSEAAIDDDATWFPGQFKSTLETTIKKLKNKGVDFSRVSLIKGFYSDTLNEKLKENHNLKKASLIMIDCDLYSSTKTALDFCDSLIRDRAIIIFDDWLPDLDEKNLGEKKAFEEFLGEHTNYKSTLFKEYQFKGRNSGKAFLIENSAA